MPNRPGVEGLEVRLALSGEPFLAFGDQPAESGSTLLFFDPTDPDPDWPSFPWEPGPIDFGPIPPPDGDQLPTLPGPDGPDGVAPIDPPVIGAPGAPTPPGVPSTPAGPGLVPLRPGPPLVELPAPVDPGPAVEPPPKPTPLVVTAEPSHGAEVAFGSIDALAVSFSTPILAAGLAPENFKLERIGDDGHVEPIFDESNPMPQRLDANGTRLLLGLPGSLGPGRYRLTMYGGSVFSTAGGALVVVGERDEILTEFRIAPAPTGVAPAPTTPARPPDPPVPGPSVPSGTTPTAPGANQGGVTLALARSLGTIGPEIVRVADTLDLAADPDAVRLYRVELAPGHFWRLGLEVSAGREGSPLLAKLALFDADGRLIATGKIGRLDGPLDPFLFAGLAPGTYYVGVSGAANDPAKDGYDPATGISGTALGPQQGGAFSLALVADAADTPTRVLGLTVDRADPADPVPTGFTVRFDGPVQRAQGGTVGVTEPRLIEVIDQNGRVWRAIAVSYDEASSALSFVFLDRLPRGSYEVRLASGALVDLTGRAPVGEGMPGGVLGRFEITSEPSSRHPDDLGALLPARAAEGVAVGMRLGPGEARTTRFVITVGVEYFVRLLDPTGSLIIELIGPDGPVDLDASIRDGNGHQTELRPGVYFLRVVNSGPDEVDASVELRLLAHPNDSVPLNGVGQGPALGMRLIDLAIGRPGSAPGPILVGTSAISGATGPFAGPETPATSTSDPATAPAGADPGQGSAPGPILTLDLTPLGRPTAEVMRIAAVGPDRAEGLAATASIAEGRELARLVPIGQGQSVDRLADQGWLRSDPGTERQRWPSEPASGQGGPVVHATPEGRRQAPPSSTELIDSVLALLGPSPDASPGINDLFGPAPVVPLLSGAIDSVQTPKESEADGLASGPVIRAVGLGLVAGGWTARRWSRRRSRPGLPTGTGRGPRPDPRREEAEDSLIINDLIRRHPWSSPARRAGSHGWAPGS